MSREDLLDTNLKIGDPSQNLKRVCPNAFMIASRTRSMMVYALKKITGGSKAYRGMSGADTPRFAVHRDGTRRVDEGRDLVLGGHGDDMVPITRLTTVGGIPVGELIPKERLDAIITRTRRGGAELVELYKTGSAYYAPAASAIEMAEAYLRDQKRVLPCCCWLEGEFGIDGLYFGVPCVIGAGGVEKILGFALTPDEKAMIEKSAASVRKTISETKL